MGGLIILVGLLAAYFIGIEGGALFPNRESPAFGSPVRIVGNAVAWPILLLGFGLIGFLDDFAVPKLFPPKRGLGWVPKLVMQFACALPAAWYSGYTDPLTAFEVSFVIVAFSNAFNFSDGMDALAGGLAVILGLSLAGIGYFWHAPLCQMWLSLTVVGASLPFLVLNAPPAKVFMGDVGSLPIGAVLGWLTLQSGGQHELLPSSPGWVVSVFLLSLVLIAELVPVPLQILSVKLRKKRLFPKTPIHHAFESAGWSEYRVVSMFHLFQAIASFAAISVAQQTAPKLWWM